MAEGVLEGILGGEGAEEIEGEAPGSASSDSVAMAAALDAARHDPKLSRKLGGYVDRQAALAEHQTRLIQLQTEHLHEQRMLTLSHLRWRRFSDRMKAVLQVMTAVVGLGVAFGVGWMAWSASQERGLVIEPFSVPPDMAARGLNGQVMASILLDKLGKMQSATVSARAPSSFANNWNDEIKVEIPETGVSVGELRRLLVQWLGHQTTISGEVYRTATGVAVAARTGAAVANPHEGPETDLDNLVQQAAQDVFATSQPYRYAIYVENSLGDVPGAKKVLERLARTGDRLDRVWAYAALDNLLTKQGDFAGAIRASNTAIAIDPDFNLARANRGGTQAQLGHAEAGAADAAKAAELTHQFGPRYMKPEALAYVTPMWEAVTAETKGDFSRAIADDLLALANPGQESLFQSLALDEVSLHDVPAARAAIAQFPVGQSAGVISDPAQLQYFYLEAALDMEDWPGAWRAYAAMDPARLGPGDRLALSTQFAPDAAVARAEMGDIQGARALVATTPLDCYTCVMARGRVESIVGDAKDADRWFAEAVRQAPAMTFAYAYWARALLDRGDAAGAISKAEAAHRLGPRFADPLETWGEALMKTGDYDGAAAKFAEAANDAPRWGLDHLRWGEALLRTGRYRQARAQFLAASGMDLPRPDRAALAVFLTRTSSGPLAG